MKALAVNTAVVKSGLAGDLVEDTDYPNSMVLAQSKDDGMKTTWLVTIGNVFDALQQRR